MHYCLTTIIIAIISKIICCCEYQHTMPCHSTRTLLKYLLRAHTVGNQSHYRPEMPEGARMLGFPDYVTMSQDGGEVVSLMHWPLLLLVLISVRD